VGRVGLREGKQIVVVVTDTIQPKGSILGDSRTIILAHVL
jgi:hypothetical protein